MGSERPDGEGNGPAELEHGPGLSQSFSDRCASCIRGQHGPTFGYGMGFQTAEFLSMIVPKQVASWVQIIRRSRPRLGRLELSAPRWHPAPVARDAGSP